MSSAPVRTGQFPFFDLARQFEIWQCTPLDQGGRLIQLELIGSEIDEQIVRAIRDPKFFAPWGDPIRWNSLESTQVERSCWLNRWYVLPSFARRYYVTGDRSYLDDLLRLLRAWAKDNPPPADTHAYFQTKAFCWRDMQVAWRTRNFIWCYFLGAPGFSDAERHELYGMIGEHARVLHEYFGAQPLGLSNHQSHAAAVMLYAGALFPDLPIAAVLRNDAIAVLEHHLNEAFYADGNSVELAPGYYPFIASNFRDALMICKANHLPIPRRSEERLDQCRTYLRQVAQPDGSMPPINDSSETPAMPFLRTLDFVLDTKPADVGSHCFESSGQAVMRDENQYLFADAGPLMLYHWHGGKMGFHLWSGGERFIVDSGECNYDRPNRLVWYVTPPAHNSLLIDDDGDYDRERLKLDGSMSADCRVVDWRTSPQFDCLTMIHNGFQKRSGMRWVRSICLIKTAFTIVVDQVVGTMAHEIALPFHFAPGDVELADAKTCRWCGAACTGELMCADDSIFEHRRITSGLVSRGSKDMPASILTFRAHRASVRAAFLLATYPSASPVVHAIQQKQRDEQLEVTAHRGSLTAHLRLPAFTPAMLEPSLRKIDMSIDINK